MEHITTTTENAEARDGIFLTREDLALLAPWLHDTLTPLDREDENSDLCQALTHLLTLSHRHYGTPAPSRSTCICRG
ncbi:hypothetical protein ABZ499_32805 [Streptomyces sp. NPDC019990]|uniref:hypothetical protein n=1 Tax=Streptomyces sp. NPDC019990 TaxID=3154693 RepID=UPI0033D1762A